MSENIKEKISHGTMYVAGWRPFIGWVCGISLLYNFLIQPVIILFTELQPVALDIGQLVTILIAMLGLSGMRTYEKQKEIQSLSVKKGSKKQHKNEEVIFG